MQMPGSRALLRSLRLCPWTSIFFTTPSNKFLDLLPQLPCHLCKNGTLNTSFLQRKRARTDLCPKFFGSKLFLHPPGVMDVRTLGSWMSAPRCLFFQGFQGLPEVLDPGRPQVVPFGCFFNPPSMRNRRSQFSAISMGFPQILNDFQSTSIKFLSFSISFGQLQSVLITYNQFESVWLRQKRRNVFTTGGGGNNTQLTPF